MRKQVVEYTTELDALIALAKQLNMYETQYNMTSEDFFNQYCQGKTADDEIFIEWAGNYRHYLALHQNVESKLKNFA